VWISKDLSAVRFADGSSFRLGGLRVLEEQLDIRADNPNYWGFAWIVHRAAASSKMEFTPIHSPEDGGFRCQAVCYRAGADPTR
ncbi:MAG: hypothetical protein MUQ10_06010, partial [Anaerolineae bacterium]|nr:hypothetical protein [Anaerolineae bacterium]